MVGVVAWLQPRGFRLKTIPSGAGKAPNATQTERAQPTAQSPSTALVPPTAAPSVEAPTGAHTGSRAAPNLDEREGAGPKLHSLDRGTSERRTGRRTSALKTRKIDWYQRQLRRPVVRQAFRELYARRPR